MRESQFLNRALEMIGSRGASAACDYLLEARGKLEFKTSQFYNYLYCLAALSNKKEDALKWLEEAIIKMGYWYRPSVFKDSDLQILFDEDRFNNCKKISEKRYSEALLNARTKCTWKSKKSPSIFLALHGNQQNIDICKENWEFIDKFGYQIEYIQSSELDSKNLFRWDDSGDGYVQLKETIDEMQWDKYRYRTLCGFSAGCNVILKAVSLQMVPCEQIILVSPWIPFVNSNSYEAINALLKRKIKVLFICGLLDEDCIQFRNFVESAKSSGVDVTDVWVEGLAHDFPENFEFIIKEFLGV